MEDSKAIELEPKMALACYNRSLTCYCLGELRRVIEDAECPAGTA